VLEDLPDSDPRWWDQERLDYFWQHLEKDHRPRLQHLMSSPKPLQFTATRRGRRRGLREQIFNLRNDGLASCLRTPKGGSSIQFVVRAGRGTVQVRRILALESARLQGVGLPGDDYLLPDSEQDGLFGFGDAVCVPAVQWVMQHSIEQHINGHEGTGAAQLALDLKDAV
jgi:DNA (cytosine-5)-methyltransferase 1